MTERERFQRKMSLNGEPTVCCRIDITYPVWQAYGERLGWLEGFSEHIHHVGIERRSSRPANSEETDRWGCHWVYPLEALDGACTTHPVAAWSDLARYRTPDPEEFANWECERGRVAALHEQGKPAGGGTDHGFIFLRLTYLRGFEKALMDMAEGRPELDELTARVEGYWMEVVKRWVEVGVDFVGFGDDLGLQHALPIRPDTWRQYIKPSYERIFSYCRSRGVHVDLHTDGYIVDIIPDLLECGVSELNPQDLVNGLENLEQLAKGKVHLRLDLDRQRITVFGSPDEIDAHVRDCVATLGSPKGGMTLVWAVYPGTPLASIEAVARAMDRYATYWRDER